MHTAIFRAALLIAGLTVSSVASAGFSLSDGFLPDSNPNSNNQWTAGGYDASGAATSFTPFTSTIPNFAGTPVDVYTHSVSVEGNPSFPAGLYNTSNSPFVNGTTQFAPHETALNPADGGFSGVFRFAVPTTGLYDLTAAFRSIDTRITNDEADGVEVFIRLNSIDLATSSYLLNPALITTVGGTISFLTSSLSLTQGQTVDFVVGPRANFNFDGTGVSANFVSALTVPEPASLSIAALGMAGFGAWSLRKSRRNKRLANGDSAE